MTGTVTLTITFTITFAVTDKNVTAKVILKVTVPEIGKKRENVQRQTKGTPVKDFFVKCNNAHFFIHSYNFKENLKKNIFRKVSIQRKLSITNKTSGLNSLVIQSFYCRKVVFIEL